MDEEEKKMLKEIDDLHSKLLNEPYGHFNGVYTMKPSGYSYSMYANQMLEKIFQLKSKFDPDYLTEECISAYAHTCDKEVSHVEYHYKNASKKNAAQKRQTEFINSIHKANQQIGLDLFSLFHKISEVKDNMG